MVEQGDLRVETTRGKDFPESLERVLMTTEGRIALPLLGVEYEGKLELPCGL